MKSIYSKQLCPINIAAIISYTRKDIYRIEPLQP